MKLLTVYFYHCRKKVSFNYWVTILDSKYHHQSDTTVKNVKHDFFENVNKNQKSEKNIVHSNVKSALGIFILSEMWNEESQKIIRNKRQFLYTDIESRRMRQFNYDQPFSLSSYFDDDVWTRSSLKLPCLY